MHVVCTLWNGHLKYSACPHRVCMQYTSTCAKRCPHIHNTRFILSIFLFVFRLAEVVFCCCDISSIHITHTANVCIHFSQPCVFYLFGKYILFSVRISSICVDLCMWIVFLLLLLVAVVCWVLCQISTHEHDTHFIRRWSDRWFEAKKVQKTMHGHQTMDMVDNTERAGDRAMERVSEWTVS